MLDRRRAWGLVGALALSLGACAPGDDDFGDDFEELELRSGDDGGTVTFALPGRPGDGGGGDNWIGNGLYDIDISGIDPAYGLSTPQGMAEGGELLTNPALRGTAEYLVECALPAGQSISKVVDGVELVFEGALGLAPQWQDYSCGSNCQEWITACLLARTNASAEEVPIWLSGNHLTLGLGRSPIFPLHEATFFGNMFEDPEAMYFCRGQPSGVVAAYLDGRTCTGLEPEACGFTHYGNCYLQGRCEYRVRDGHLYTVECAAGDPSTGHRYKSISTFVMDPED